MELGEILKRRRMVRAYEPRPVARETLERIVGTIRPAPSAGFSQGQRLVVVTQPERRREIAGAVGEDFYGQDGDEIEWPVPYWYADAGAAAMLILLAAIDEGLAAGVFGIPAERMEAVRELLQLPADLAIVEVITLGHPAEDAASDRLSSRGTRPRRPLDQLIRWETWT